LLMFNETSKLVLITFEKKENTRTRLIYLQKLLHLSNVALWRIELC
jgi:hypothetical protein